MEDNLKPVQQLLETTQHRPETNKTCKTNYRTPIKHLLKTNKN